MVHLLYNVPFYLLYIESNININGAKNILYIQNIIIHLLCKEYYESVKRWTRGHARA